VTNAAQQSDANKQCCTIQGEVTDDDVVWMAEPVVAAGADEAGLSDTTGMANPAQVKRLFTRVRSAIGNKTGAAHAHNTCGLGLANGLAAYENGVRIYDLSLGDLGGCPYAPGATGNVVNEELAFMFEAMGLRTGVDLGKVMSARQPLMAGLPGELIYGMTPSPGLSKGWDQH
jgi:hydroxymethylglutaryl-CoA lyase